MTKSNRIRWCILNLKIEFRGIFVKLFVDYLFSVYINGFRGFNLIADNVVFKGLSRAPEKSKVGCPAKLDKLLDNLIFFNLSKPIVHGP